MHKVTCFGRKLFVTAALLGTSLLSLPTHAESNTTWQQVRQAGVLRCGAAASAPWVMRDPKTGNYSGLFPDLCRQFGEQVLKVKVEFADTSWDNIVAGLQSGKWDVSLSLNDTPERRQSISFTAPVVDYSVDFVYNKNNPRLPKKITSLADIDKPEYTFAVMSGTAQDKAISSVLKRAKIMRLPGFDETRLSLMSKRADFLADDSMSNTLLLRAHPDWAAAFTPNPLLAKQSINFGVRKDIPAADLAQFDQFIKAKQASGDVKKMSDAGVDLALAQK
ncbi:transporter substrate-binding domain-containing protein [Candidatus Pantoea multigeneris]|uniref:Transporter substrate-binding domain-containing protein n=1 Tax=Candidatus Pantoea multigeneris TaxID=2608357 RepID=A0ABX0R6M3_9GAMM|nr:transporter substrate-binding domain-containing protein [Pantoea multigeneris]NIF20008.1 transporter substrate-binding domain-containing protein [Pantoea multigeneris]